MCKRRSFRYHAGKNVHSVHSNNNAKQPAHRQPIYIQMYRRHSQQYFDDRQVCEKNKNIKHKQTNYRIKIQNPIRKTVHFGCAEQTKRTHASTSNFMWKQFYTHLHTNTLHRFWSHENMLKCRLKSFEQVKFNMLLPVKCCMGLCVCVWYWFNYSNGAQHQASVRHTHI